MASWAARVGCWGWHSLVLKAENGEEQAAWSLERQAGETWACRVWQVCVHFTCGGAKGTHAAYECAQM